jgi:hypothetical protein
VPETPYNTAQLELQAKVIKDDIQRHITSLPTLTNRALNQLVKGCQLAMNSAILLTEENRQLRGENEKQKKKRVKKRAYIATGGVLTVQEGLDLAKRANTEAGPRVAESEATVQTRAPRTCSLCGCQAHTARTCPTKQASN